MRELLLIAFFFALVWSAANLSCVPDVLSLEEIEFSDEVASETLVLSGQHGVSPEDAHAIARLNVDKRRRLNGYNSK